MAPAKKIRNQGVILLVEDNPNDVDIFKYAIQKNNIRDRIEVVTDGFQAVKYLSEQARAAEKSGKKMAPQLVITDLKMPGFSGLQLVEWMCGHQKFRRLPVVLLTSSNLAEEKAKAYQFGVCSFYVKPITATEFVAMVKHIYQYWMKNPAELSERT